MFNQCLTGGRWTAGASGVCAVSFHRLFDWLSKFFKERSTRDTTAPTVAGQTRILLMRHAEKTGDKDDIHLSKGGRKRAERLADYIPREFGKPDFLFAAAPSKNSIRSIETLQPLADATGVRLNCDIEDKQFLDLTRRLISAAEYAGKLIVICWHHNSLPAIAAALGAQPGTYPPDWDEDVFDLIVDLAYQSGAKPNVQLIQQPFS